ncbi:hypothetical protein LCGC14_2874770 [marine sediment metagenome]|uniref:Uncharacterized protein n=1 Tax=marine sediment metagenome TaxID=412755 RepID=A0A0F8Y1T8_9ZZZZ
MPSYNPPKKNTAYITYIALVSRAGSFAVQDNPTLATGDFKVSIDGGTLNNLATIPAVTPASSRMVKISLSSSEMNGDNITLVGVDAAGAEWGDVVITLQTAPNQFDTVGVAVGGILDGSLVAAELNNIADGMLDRIMSVGTDSGGDNTTARTVRQALRVLRNKVSITGGTATITEEDDSTTSFTAAITTAAGNPITTIDPT